MDYGSSINESLKQLPTDLNGSWRIAMDFLFCLPTHHMESNISNENLRQSDVQQSDSVFNKNKRMKFHICLVNQHKRTLNRNKPENHLNLILKACVNNV